MTGLQLVDEVGLSLRVSYDEQELLRADVVVADGAHDPDGAEEFAALGRATLT